MTDLTKQHPAVVEVATFVASVCHAVNRAICQAFGDDSQVEFKDAPAWQRESAVKGVIFAMDNPDAPPSAQHDAWSADKIADGWTYGPVKDPIAKTHHCLVPYDQLPPEQKAKDYAFQAVVKAIFADR